MTDIQVLADPLAVGAALATRIADAIAAAEGDFLLGCPGGRSPVTTYAALGQLAVERRLDLSRVRIVMMDDYLEPDGDGWRRIPADRHNSCERFARVEIRDVLNAGLPPERQVPADRVHLPNPADPAAYDRWLTELGGIDFFILASGAGDGHVAFNPPGSPADSRTRVVELAEQTKIDNLATFPDFAGVDDVPTHGVTVGIATIAEQSKDAAMVIHGAGKREAFDRVTGVAGYDPQWPATVVNLVAGSTVFADQAAAGTAAPESDDPR